MKNYTTHSDQEIYEIIFYVVEKEKENNKIDWDDEEQMYKLHKKTEAIIKCMDKL